MMGKKEKHWNDGKHRDPKSRFQTGCLADEIHRDFIRFILNDFQPEAIEEAARAYSTSRLTRMASVMEDICTILRDGWSINKWYEVDFEQRRIRWIEARGLCFRLMAMLENVTIFVPHVKNKQKYADLSARLMELSGKIYNLMLADDAEKKKKAKNYRG